MAISIEVFELRNLLTDAAELGAKKALISAGITRPTISQTKAYELYGRARVDRWVKDKLIKRNKDGKNTSSVTFDALDLETLDKTKNRIRYFHEDSSKLSG
jgi:hypothetical protein